MHDITYIRQHPEAFDAAMQRRGLPPQSAQILTLDAQRRAHITQVGELQHRRNHLSKAIGMKKKAGEDAQTLMEESKAIAEEITRLEQTLQDASELDELLASLPNIIADDSPDGEDESSNQLYHTWGVKPAIHDDARQHFEIGETLGQMDFDTAAHMSGSRFVVLRHGLARLERALANFMLDCHISQFDYEEVSPPLMVRDAAMFGTGQLPKFAEDSFRTTNGYWLIPTAEVSLTNMVAGSIMSEAELPKRFCAHTPCFRSEAGSAGRDTRGMIRQHQFSKVELVSITTPEHSADEHARMLSAAEHILQALELHYRVMLLCAGDTGFSAHKTYDIEVWLPGQHAYREISSCSNFLAFQARRMKARYRPEGEKKAVSVHTLNGSGLAIGRTIVAILEQYQTSVAPSSQNRTFALKKSYRSLLGSSLPNK
ncbi:MAG: serine--tRNA ligase, partial [Sphaerospermopsis sp. SIO1G2]|nr:serine--tRNA ligase [Sphaerospermopsis sp. SIO1G2]